MQKPAREGRAQVVFVTHETGEKAAAKAVDALNDGEMRVESVIRVEQ